MIRRASSLGLAALLLAVPAAAGAAVPPPTPQPVPPVVPVSPAACARPPGAAPSQALLGALGVLRRPAGAQDALPDTLLRLLKARGLAPVDPASVRLLRSTGARPRAFRSRSSVSGSASCAGPRGRTRGR